MYVLSGGTLSITLFALLTLMWGSCSLLALLLYDAGTVALMSIATMMSLIPPPSLMSAAILISNV